MLVTKEYFPRVERFLYNIPRWKVRIKTLQLQVNELPSVTQQFKLVPSFGSGNISDSTAQTAERRIAAALELATLQRNIAVAEEVLQGLTDEQREIVELKYFKRFTNTATWMSLNLSRSEFYRKRNLLVDNVYELLGGEFSTILYPDTTYKHEETA
ncbi:hypothetical protein [Paenibacillus naphthalenovorans]|uniref:hypothetical protein n=1 Tax=Paenibacillus naphthalenovorans TaxID=162209 RepID=UPI003D29F970